MKLKAKKWQVWLGIFVLVFVLYHVSSYVFLYCNDAYVEADLIPITPRVTGYLNVVAVKNNQHVHKGDLLVQIDPTFFQLTVEQQTATLTQAQAQLSVQNAKVQSDQQAVSISKDQVDLASVTLDRYQKLAKNGMIDQQSLNNQQVAQNTALANFVSANATLSQDQHTQSVLEAQITNAQKALDIAKYNLSLTTIKAPADGYINHLFIYPGTHVTQDTPIFGLLADHSWRVIANYKEGALSHLKENQTVWVMISSNLGHIYVGQVKSYGRAVARDPSASNPALPYIAPTTDWIRYPYRFPVTISLPDLPPDSPIGMGADVRTLVWVQ